MLGRAPEFQAGVRDPAFHAGVRDPAFQAGVEPDCQVSPYAGVLAPAALYAGVLSPLDAQAGVLLPRLLPQPSPPPPPPPPPAAAAADDDDDHAGVFEPAAHPGVTPPLWSGMLPLVLLENDGGGPDDPGRMN